jgi:hypothetical protein
MVAGIRLQRALLLGYLRIGGQEVRTESTESIPCMGLLAYSCSEAGFGVTDASRAQLCKDIKECFWSCGVILLGAHSNAVAL